ncbi:hypothetical protein Efla_002426 [Eimeria flavescens]
MTQGTTIARIAGKERLDLKISLSQDYGASDEDGLGKPSLQVSADAKPTAFLGPRLQGRKALRNWASISTVLVVLAVVMISLCLRASKNLVSGGLTRRRLAHGGEEEDNDDAMLDTILEDCLDMEEAAGWASHHGASDPMAATTEEVKPALQAVSTGFSTGLGSPPSASAPQTMPEVYTSTSSSMVTDPLQPLDSVVSEGTARPSIFSPASTAPLPSIPPEDASDSLLLSQFPSSSWVIFIPKIWLEWPWLQGEATASGFQETLEDYEQPSTSASTSAEPTGETSTEAEVAQATGGIGGAAQATDASPSILKELGNLSMHPFIRLPIVPPEAIPRDFNPQWFKPMFGRTGQQMLLCRIRERLLKPELDAAEVQQLMLETEKLVRIAAARARIGASPKGPWHRIRYLGTIFLILDVVVSVRELLGPRMAASRWWDQFVNSLPTDYQPTKARPDAKIMTKINHKLVALLLAGIKTFKTGVRPDLKEVLKVKRMLLCSPYSIKYFKEHQFDPWRKDDEEFRQAQGEVSDDSTDEEDD